MKKIHDTFQCFFSGSGFLVSFLVTAVMFSSCTSQPTGNYQGYVEGEFVQVSSAVGGRLDELTVSRGDKVAAGDALFVLEHAREDAAVAEARQGVEKAKNILADQRKGRRQPEIEAIEARLDQAKTTYILSRDEFERRVALYGTGAIPQEELDRARTDMERNSSLMAQISAELESARLAARPDLLEAARADLEAAGYRLQQALWALDQKSRTAPASGLIFDTYYQEGEFVPASYPVLSILPPANIKIRFFVSEAILGSLTVDQKISVTLDGVTDIIPATITYISPQAEYTPPVIYSRETRSKLVFMVEAVPAAEFAAGLHPGQPVTVRLEPTDG